MSSSSSATSPATSRPSVRSLAKALGPTTTLGIAMVLFIVLITLLAPLLSPYDPIETDSANALRGASAEHWLGTDAYGRDVLSRVLYGGRFALLVSVLATTIAVGVGTMVGSLAAYFEGFVDGAITRVLDAILAVPATLWLLLIVSVFGSGTLVIVTAISVVYSPAVARVIRGAARAVMRSAYVVAAQARGERAVPVIVREIIPNILDTILVEYAMRACWVILLVSTLSFLGFGVNPPTPDWGLMIQENRTALVVAPMGTLAPIIALAVLVVGLNVAADGLGKYFGVDRAQRGV